MFRSSGTGPVPTRDDELGDDEVKQINQLIDTAQQAARRLRDRPEGWPRTQAWPLFAHKMVCSGLTVDEFFTWDSQTLVWVAGIDQWLGKDGSLYWRPGVFIGLFFREIPWLLPFSYSTAEIAQAIKHLEQLGR